MKVGFNWEWQNSQNPSSGATIKSGDFGEAETMRKAEVWFSGGWGKVSLGQGDGAGNGTTEMDLSDTWNVIYYGRTSFGGAIAWRTGAGAGITSGGSTTAASAAGALTNGDTYSEFDAFSRYDRIRYDSPSLGPVTLSVSAGQADRYEGAARWSQGLGGGQINAGLFYGKQNNLTKNRYGGSVSYLFSFGTNITVAGAENDPDAAGSTKGSTWYVKVGHKWGNNAVAVAYGESKDVTPGFTNKGFQIGFNHNIPKAKVDVYAGFQGFELNTPASTPSVEDIYNVILGTKLKFD